MFFIQDGEEEVVLGKKLLEIHLSSKIQILNLILVSLGQAVDLFYQRVGILYFP